MGLDTSHDAWHGSYSTFDRWRELVAEAAGFPSLRKMKGFGGSVAWDALPPTADRRLIPLLNHSDCDGEIEVEHLLSLAAALEVLLDTGSIPNNLSHEDCRPEYVESIRNLWRNKTRTFAAGCRRAAAAGEPLDFH